MWFTSTSFTLATFISVMLFVPSSNGYGLGGGPIPNTLGCCMVPCPPKGPSCDCPCGFPSPPLPPMLPQFPSLLPPSPLFPQYPAYPSGAYATPDSNNVRQQVAENGLQQPFAHKTLPGISSQQRQSYQNGGTYGYNVKQLEQSNGGVFSGYATGPYGVENGNLGEYSSSYSLPHRVQNENRFGASSSQLPVSGMGQYMAGPYNHRVQPDTPVAVTVGTTGTEFSSSPVTGDYEKRTKHF